MKILFRINVALAVIIALTTIWAMCASADEFKEPKIQQHDKRFIKVMIIDTGVDTSNHLLTPFFKDTSVGDMNYVDVHGHGTHIAGLIIYGPLTKKGDLYYGKRNQVICHAVRLYSCRYFNRPDSMNNLSNTIKCLKAAYQYKMDVVNYSSGGTTISKEEYDILKKLESIGTVVTVAAGNEGKSLKEYNYYPASYAFMSYKYRLHNLIPVENATLSKNEWVRHGKSDYGFSIPVEIGTDVYSTMPGDKIGQATGTSQATAIHLHRLLIDKCRELGLD